MNPLEKEVAPLSTFESKLIKENQNLLKKLDQQTQRITEQTQQITEQTQQIAEQLLSGVKGYHHCDGYSGYKNLPNIE